MTGFVLAFGVALSVAAAAAGAPRELVFGQPNDPQPVRLPMPEGAVAVDCEPEPTSNLYCLRLEASREAAVVAMLSSKLGAQGLVFLGKSDKTRPFTTIYRRVEPGNSCPPLIWLLAADSVQNKDNPLPPGTIELTVTQTADPTCFFDKKTN